MWKLKSTGGRPFEAATATWSSDGEICSKTIEFAGKVRQVCMKPRADQTVEVRAHGPDYSMCEIMRPPDCSIRR